MVNAERTRLADDRPRRRDIHALGLQVDGATKDAPLVVVVNGSPVASRDNQQRAAVHIHVVDENADGDDVVVGVRMERPILMPLDGGASTPPPSN